MEKSQGMKYLAIKAKEMLMLKEETLLCIFPIIING